MMIRLRSLDRLPRNCHLFSSRLLFASTSRSYSDHSKPKQGSASKQCDALRILFCGSDLFSIESLKALHQLKNLNPKLIESIDVVSKPPKPFGRGMKKFREVAIAPVARKFNLPLHQIDTFTGWELPHPTTKSGGPINLIVAVSFGLFVPPRLLSQVKYGGLNIHPSMLPEFRGPAPIHHVLLAGRTKTGVTLQTLHPERMDHGKILLQTPQPGFDIPDPSAITTAELVRTTAFKGAELLVRGIKNCVFVEPVRDLSPILSEEETRALPVAPKISPRLRVVRWNAQTAEEILLRQRVLGILWNMLTKEDVSSYASVRRVKVNNFEEGQSRDIRIKWEGQFRVASSQIREALLPYFTNKDKPIQCLASEQSGNLYVLTKDKQVLSIDCVMVEGYGMQSPFRILKKLNVLEKDGVMTQQLETDIRSNKTSTKSKSSDGGYSVYYPLNMMLG